MTSFHSHRACAVQGAQRGDRWCAESLGHSGSRKEPKMSARSCDQLCLITADRM
ncbi:unnamed protein product [Staurois parvus]|uniref:Uncharacterized protein n=1 Tax=Staurois parvus TaxID=386267 RepID=A0ABN9EWH3_9NEOB|nr:unnamed protein product [Staurois parvus]